jgi:hypothetical protein
MNGGKVKLGRLALVIALATGTLAEAKTAAQEQDLQNVFGTGSPCNNTSCVDTTECDGQTCGDCTKPLSYCCIGFTGKNRECAGDSSGTNCTPDGTTDCSVIIDGKCSGGLFTPYWCETGTNTAHGVGTRTKCSATSC